MTGGVALIELGNAYLWAALMVFLRVASALAVMPALGEQTLSIRVRLVITLMLTAIVTPAALPILPYRDLSLVSFVQPLITETFAGVFIGLFLRMFVLALQTAGSIAAQSTSLAQLMGQAGVDPLPAIGHVLTVAGLALLMATGFHVRVAEFIILSYSFFPPFEFPSPTHIAHVGSQHIGQTFSLAFTLAAPFVILSVIYNLTLGVINKAMPQLMVAFVGAPVISFGAILFLFLSAPTILTSWRLAFERFLAAPFQ